MQSEVINRLRSAIEYVEADKAQDYDNAETTGERVDLNDYNVSLSLEDAKALEAALPALAQKELCPCGDSLRSDRCQCGSFSKDEALIPSAEQERLRFEGDLDKWMKIIGAGITGYQPEAYAVMDAACEELVKLRATLSTEQQPSPAMATSQALINLATAVLGHAPATANEFMSISLDDIRSALSAQVQDVAGLSDDYYSDDPAKLKQLLAQRDKWIVDNDHWHDFTRSLPAAPVKQEGGK